MTEVFVIARSVSRSISASMCSTERTCARATLAMSRLPRTSFALLFGLMPATATLIGALVLSQIPGWRDIAGVLLVMLGVAIHRPAPVPASAPDDLKPSRA